MGAQFRAVGQGPQLVICATCRAAGAADPDSPALVDLARRLCSIQPDFAGIAIEEMACLFACSRPHAVHVRAAGKMAYVLGGFTPDEDSVRALLTFAARYAESEDGMVPYSQWPEGVKGHFIVRVPPQGYVVS